MLVFMPHFMSTAGICVGYFTCYENRFIEDLRSHDVYRSFWRLRWLLVLAVSCLYLPTSPRWLLIKGGREDALRELERLHLSKAGDREGYTTQR